MLFQQLTEVKRATRPRRGLCRRRAQTLVEMAFVVPMLLALMIGILEFGWVTKNTMTLASAAREGARAAAVGKTTQQVIDTVKYYANPIPLSSPAGSIVLEQCDANGSNCGGWPGDNALVSPAVNGVKAPSLLRVTLTSSHQSLTGLVPGLNGRVLTARVTIRRES